MSAAQAEVLAGAGRAARRRKERLFVLGLLGALSIGMILLVALLIDVMVTGVPRLSLDFLRDLPSRFADRAGAGEDFRLGGAHSYASRKRRTIR